MPLKRFGQHFLRDSNALDRIISAIAPQSDDYMLEIGPGQGALTERLLLTLHQLQAIEIDRNLSAGLQHKFSREKLEVYECDALKFDFGLISSPSNKIRVVGNLPYNISTPLLFHMTTYIKNIQNCYFLLQKEVVDRMAAPPGNKQYGRLSVMCQLYFKVKPLFNIHPNCFFPPPKVNSAFVALYPRLNYLSKTEDLELLKEIVRTAFTQRRKMIKKSLKTFIDVENIQSIELDPTLRPEMLSLENFITLSNKVTNLTRFSQST